MLYITDLFYKNTNLGLGTHVAGYNCMEHKILLTVEHMSLTKNTKESCV